MNDHFGKNLFRLRKEHRMTQEQLANLLGVAPQSVSRWENSQVYPDTELLPQIASLLHVSIDALLGHRAEGGSATHYEDKYQNSTYYWGNDVWSGCYDVLKLMPPIRPLRLLDVGCGEGQAAVFFAKNGYTVSAFDLAESGIEKGRQLAALHHVDVDFFRGDLLDLRLDYRLEQDFDIVYSSGVLQYIPPQARAQVIENLKAHTAVGGIHILNVFVKKPFVETAPDWEAHEYFWHSGELMGYYHDWKFEYLEEKIFDCDSSGIPHQHCMDVLIARKI